MVRQDSEKMFISKKCPECYEYIPLESKVCPFCKVRVGKIGKHGMAERLTNWRAYIICITLWIILGIYVKWAFF
jgi:RNA polymerase subunit RPABC4/transcription elongation factor Spt4